MWVSAWTSSYFIGAYICTVYIQKIYCMNDTLVRQDAWTLKTKIIKYVLVFLVHHIHQDDHIAFAWSLDSSRVVLFSDIIPPHTLTYSHDTNTLFVMVGDGGVCVCMWLFCWGVWGWGVGGEVMSLKNTTNQTRQITSNLLFFDFISLCKSATLSPSFAVNNS